MAENGGVAQLHLPALPLASAWHRFSRAFCLFCLQSCLKENMTPDKMDKDFLSRIFSMENFRSGWPSFSSVTCTVFLRAEILELPLLTAVLLVEQKGRCV